MLLKFFKSCSLIIFSFLCFNPILHAQNNSKELPKFFLGSEKAPVTIYEFISLSCYYCKDNINLFLPPQGEENDISKLIKEGKVKVVIMDFPIHGKVDYLAHSILYFSKDNQQFFNLVKLFINNQSKWFDSKDPGSVIINYARLTGMDNQTIEEYKKNNYIEKIIYNNANNYLKRYNIRATPTTIIEKSSKPISKNSFYEMGVCNITPLVKEINKLLK